MKRLLLLCSVLAVQAVSINLKDRSFDHGNLDCTIPVTTVNSTQLVTYPTVFKCINNIPLLDQVKSGTLQSLHQIMKMYAFRDIVRNSPPSGNHLIHVQVDLDQQFNDIANISFTADYQFQEAIVGVYTSLKDPHTLYIKPQTCYGFSMNQPFAINSRIDRSSGQQIIYIRDLVANALLWNKQYPDLLPLNQFVNWTIVAIDGSPALQYLIDFSYQHGFISKDIGSLFNYALKRQFGSRHLTLDPLPSNPVVTYTLQQTSSSVPVVISVPWLAVNPGPTPITLNVSCLGNFSESSPELQGNQVPGSPVPPYLRYLEQQQPTPTAQPSPHLLPVFSADSISTYVLNKEVLVLKITSFEPSDSTKFLDTVFSTIDLAATFSVPYLILDLRGNGGGDICLGYQVIDGLMEESNPYGHYDVIHSPLTTQLINLAAQPQNADQFFSPSFWIDPDTHEPYTNTSWYSPGKYHVRAGVGSYYSELVHLGCNDTSSPVQYLFKKILLLTDGLCGSTCAVVSSHLAEADHVDTVVLGGLQNRAQQYFSFPGGEVFSLAGVLEWASEMGLNSSTLLPKPFPAASAVTFTLQEIYSWISTDDPNVPLEFLFKPADHRLMEWTFQSSDDLIVYEAAANFFSNNTTSNM